MARLTIDRVSKLYGAFRALDDVSLDVDDGEFVAILGPSGCGKTTLLRQIAGFDKPNAGRILIGDAVVSTPERQVPPERRRIGIVFQSYALWPHMTVAGNVAYGLNVAGVKDPERARRVTSALSLVELDGFADRSPAMLSGGQRQRVALARKQARAVRSGRCVLARRIRNRYPKRSASQVASSSFERIFTGTTMPSPMKRATISSAGSR